MAAFWELSTERPLGFGGVGPIPHSRIREWAEREGFDETETVFFIAVMRSCDDEFISFSNKTGEYDPERQVSQRPMTGKLFDTLFGKGRSKKDGSRGSSVGSGQS